MNQSEKHSPLAGAGAWIVRHKALAAVAALSLLCLCLTVAFRCSVGFAEWFSVTVGAAVRYALAVLFSPFPFSVFEALVALFAGYLLALLGIGLFYLVCRRRARWRLYSRLALIGLLAILLVLDSFALGFASCYHRKSLAEQMSLPVDEVDAESVFFALDQTVAILNACDAHLNKNEAGESVAPDWKGTREKIVRAADAFADKHAFFQKRGCEVKSFLSSPWMTYTHISGIYGFFTGEANVNVNYPHFVVTSAAAHESCHARGIAPENECNSVGAFLLMESDDWYLRYCGAVSVTDDLLTAAARLDRERTQAIKKSIPDTYWRDQAAYARFFEPYRDNVAADAATAVNDAYLKGQGQAGVISYSQIVRLVCAYFQSTQTLTH